MCGIYATNASHVLKDPQKKRSDKQNNGKEKREELKGREK